MSDTRDKPGLNHGNAGNQQGTPRLHWSPPLAGHRTRRLENRRSGPASTVPALAIAPALDRRHQSHPVTSDTEQQPGPGAGLLFRLAFTYGGASGALASLWLLLEYAFGLHGDRLAIRQYSTLVAFAVPIASIALGVMRWRDHGLGGSIRFAQAFSCALAIGFVHAALFATCSLLYVASINPDFIPGLIDFQARTMEATGASTEEVADFRTAAAAHATARAYAFAVFAQTLLSTFIIALFASVVVRRKG